MMYIVLQVISMLNSRFSQRGIVVDDVYMKEDTDALHNDYFGTSVYYSFGRKGSEV